MKPVTVGTEIWRDRRCSKSRILLEVFWRFPRFPVHCGSKSKKSGRNVARFPVSCRFHDQVPTKNWFDTIGLRAKEQNDRIWQDEDEDACGRNMKKEQVHRFTGSPQFHTHKNEERWNCLEHQAGVESVDFLCRFSSRKCGLFCSKWLRLSPTFKVYETQVPYSYNKTHPYRFPFCQVFQYVSICFSLSSREHSKSLASNGIKMHRSGSSDLWLTRHHQGMAKGCSPASAAC